ncbi:outer membrane protein assembly factor BamB family protein [Orenia marismortui]|uniref:outer membrane protein assembly factor BamB family protein n=1 Tax=Orenia marismortui TaxID=46469 RepID=UPI000361FAB3|nr:PQQ-binding-like beta-propeller repeat protein [Orenia marismortui]
MFLYEKKFLLLGLCLFVLITFVGCSDSDTENLSKEFTITTKVVEGLGEIKVIPEQETYKKGTEVTIKANRYIISDIVASYKFSHWTGSSSGKESEQTSPITSDMEIGAVFISTEIEENKWIFNTDDDIKSSPAIGEDGTVYVGSNDGNLYAINPDGTEKWKFTSELSDEIITSSPAIGEDGTIYIGSQLDLYAINSDGTKKWRLNTLSTLHSTPAIASDGTIYVGSTRGELYQINPNGNEEWKFILPWQTGSSPVIGEDGTVYIGGLGPDNLKIGYIYAFEGTGSGLANSSWPMFGNNIRHTGKKGN